ncbi:D-glycerate dehydrogenase [Oscillochloris sp. ZM17-4]|uniref:2-hydroxyacid dehydrogenase n=1 Tax=Oscillochloris sp. ZM17-4 TaxID=2866714 RepID=UPI001C733890|nr:D-glycerate dehydrogenase [Oscillochloris sp. ZM17-4]MBX0327786.1 D-glycerate dehydrogenase [Oscillochloris sp. ZM17-4]
MTRPRAYITRRLPDAAVEILRRDCEVEMWPEEQTPMPREALLRAAAGADGLLTILVDRIDQDLLDAAPRLRAVANMAVGYDNVDLPALTRRGVLLTNTPGVLTETTADLAWALMLAAGRRVVEGQKLIEAGGWGPWYPMQMVGQDIYGATLGVVGAGRIGAAVLRRARGFGMSLRYHNRRPAPAIEAETGAQYRDLDAILAEADFLVVTVPLGPETRGMFGAAQFAQMKPTSVFVNVSRGPVVREADLEAALRVGRPWAAGLDVFEREPIGADHPLLGLPNVVAVPHIGSASVATRTRMATLAAENLAAALTGRAPPTPVNPEVLG